MGSWTLIAVSQPFYYYVTPWPIPEVGIYPFMNGKNHVEPNWVLTDFIYAWKWKSTPVAMNKLVQDKRKFCIAT